MDELFLKIKDESEKERSYGREERISLFRHLLNDYHNRLANDIKTLKEHCHDLDKIITLGERIKNETGLNPADLLFWHELIGSTVSDEDFSKMTLDTPNDDIERFVQLL